ncbi:type II and III secretion system protein family protein [Pseudomonadota bacterium]
MRSQLNKMLLGAFAATALLATQTVHAQQVPGRSAASAPAATMQAPKPTKAEWVVSQKSELVRIPLNKMITVRLAGPVRNVVIADPTIADIILPEDGNRTHAYLIARAVGSTAIIFEDGSGNILFQGDVQVDVDVSGIQAAINELMPDDRIEISSQRNGVFVKGFVRSAGASAQAVEIARRFVPDNLNVVNNLEVLGSRQVVMQVRVSEMKRTAIKQLGFDFTYSLDFGTTSMGLTTAASTAISAANLGTAFATGNIIPTIAGFGNIAYQVLEENGLAKTLAEPALTAISGETATFLAGGTFPMLTSIDKDGNKSYSQTPFGVRLSFTPTVMDKGQISLQVATEVSDRDTTVAVDGIPGLKMNRTETVVDMPSGGSLIISGLIQSELVNTIDGVPGLKDVPILGTLFRSEAFRNRETELVVTVTAYLAEPVGNDARLALPSDGFAAPGDLDMYLLGHLHKQYAKTELPPYATPLSGPYGYIME